MSNRVVYEFRKFYRSIWLFPVLLAIPIIVLTSLQVSGSSIGTFHALIYGSQHDASLLTGMPRPIRSDEWLVNTQAIVSQAKSNYSRVNPYVGSGENMSLDPGIPYKDWSEVFRPQNLVFFILPLPYAFAFQWWIIGYLLIVSCYFFILAQLPRKRLLAALLALALFFCAFIQWWYEYGTLASIYYPLFIATAVVHLTRQKQRTKRSLLGFLVAYLLACFALVLYPPFQIACGLVLVAFLIGYLWSEYPRLGKQTTRKVLGTLLVSGLIAIAVVGLFVITRSNVVSTLAQTSYPGHRTSMSGDSNVVHLLASQLGYQFTSTAHTSHYQMHNVATNQSEASNFLLLSPLLIVPICLLLYKDWHKYRKVDPLLATLTVCFIVFILHLFVPAFSLLSGAFLLNKVPTTRLLIGMGLVNIAMLVAFIRRAEKQPSAYWFSSRMIKLYPLGVLALELCINFYIHHTTGTFVGIYRAVAFALPLPVVVYLLLRKRFVAAAIIYFAFSFFISFRVNPLYRGLDVITKNPLSQAMVRINKGSDRRWVADSVVTENLAAANGLHSLSGVYYYPQNSLWAPIKGAKYSDYNRYAHVTFGFYASPNATPQLKLVAQDQFRITTGICNQYLRQENVGFVLTSQKLSGPCVVGASQVTAPAATFYIYQLR